MSAQIPSMHQSENSNAFPQDETIIIATRLTVLLGVECKCQLPIGGRASQRGQKPGILPAGLAILQTDCAMRSRFSKFSYGATARGS